MSITTLANASLVDRGGGLIYDTDLNTTWLANVNGSMNWNDAMTWASNLSYYDSARNVTYTDWRLPTTMQPDATCSVQNGGVSSGWNCTGSEMGHLYYNELGGSGLDPDVALFENLFPGNFWSSTEYAPDSAWHFSFFTGSLSGLQGGHTKGDALKVLVVRPGDVAAASVVPIPTSFWLFGSGLIGFFGFMRRHKA